MPFLVTDSAAPLPAETLPALKLREFYGVPRRGCIYSYLRCYVRGGDFYYNLTVFDETPPSTQHVALALSCDDAAQSYLWAVFQKGGGERLSLRLAPAGGRDEEARPLEMPPARYVAGGDEQGLYWGAEGVIPAQAFRQAFGCVPRAGMFLPGNVFLFDDAEAAFGAAFPVPSGHRPPTGAGFEPFMIVPY